MASSATRPSDDFLSDADTASAGEAAATLGVLIAFLFPADDKVAIEVRESASEHHDYDLHVRGTRFTRRTIRDEHLPRLQIALDLLLDARDLTGRLISDVTR